ncbi:single-stranded DNA-binding protein [Streptomyces sp. TRM66268-LWL]|uniref:Single-stranded DNA-binding protein n=1 Tax=Streptomyces polyasparticus TaxID=2767826 RepID=A0ABR7STW7_9ACTN|nr:single-stranded DNA-binding protein [Streptomyces polyasparticus]MBC9718047.1 single-stranded DNA-binding protein [Streptomyces polyasparticus]
MNETLVTVVGNVATTPVSRVTANGPMVRFRLASTARYYDRTTGDWRSGHTNFLTVFAWRGLAENVTSSVALGDPVVVQGRLKVKQQDAGGAGSQGTLGVDIEAVALGHDLSRGTAAFRRVSRANPALTAGVGDAGAGDVEVGGAVAAGEAEPQFEPDPRGDAESAARDGFLPDREPEPAF